MLGVAKTLAFVLMLAVCACYRAHTPDEAGVVVDGGMVEAGGPCNWVVEELHRVTQTTLDPDLADVASLGDEVWIGWQTNLESSVATTGRQVVVIGSDASPIRDSSRVMSIPAGAIYTIGMSITRSFAGMRTAVLGHDDNQGCVFVPLANDGSILAPAHSVGTRRCQQLMPTSNGYVFFERDGSSTEGHHYFVKLDLNGNVQRRTESILDADAQFWRAVRVDDGSYYVLALSEMDGGHQLVGVRLDEGGGLVGSLSRITLTADDVTRVRAAVFGDKLMVGWTESIAGGTTEQHTLHFATFNLIDGSIARHPAPLANTVLFRDKNWNLVNLHGEAFASYVVDTSEDGFGSVGRVEMQHINADGEAEGAPIVLVPSMEAVRDPLLRETPRGAMLVLTGREPMEFSTDVYALPIRCER